MYYKAAGRPHLVLREAPRQTTTSCWPMHFRLRLPRHASSGGLFKAMPVLPLGVLFGNYNTELSKGIEAALE